MTIKTSVLRLAAGGLIAGALLATALPAFAQDEAPFESQQRRFAPGVTAVNPTQTMTPQANHVVVGFVDIIGDPRYDPISDYDRIILKLPQHPFAGAQIGIDEAAPLARILKTDFALDRIEVKSPQDVAAAVTQAMQEKNIHFFLIDAPAEAFKPLADAVKGKDVMLFNVSAPDDSLRRNLCAPEIVHTIPSLAQDMDALVQYVVFKKWRNILIMEGPLPADTQMADAFKHSAAKFGATIVADQHFTVGEDPRQREQNDPALLSAITRDYDVVFVADTAFDFVRDVPYRVVRPRPIIGSIDLVPEAWDWTWDGNGGPQVDARFAVHALPGQRMESPDYAAWIAVKMVVQSVLHTQSNDFQKDRDYILAPDTSFDGDKGLPIAVRTWDHQVKQAILLAAPYSVVASAPIPGFLHRTNYLDTLGDDQPETPCQLAK